MIRNISKYPLVLFRNRLVLRSISSGRHLLRKSEKTLVEDNQPVKYTASPAAKFRAKSSLENEDDRLWYEPQVIIASLSIFLLYFLVLREENDIDDQMFVPLHERISGLEEMQLKTVIQHSSNTEEIAEAEQRLQEIEGQKTQNG